MWQLAHVTLFLHTYFLSAPLYINASCEKLVFPGRAASMASLYFFLISAAWLLPCWSFVTARDTKMVVFGAVWSCAWADVPGAPLCEWLGGSSPPIVATDAISVLVVEPVNNVAFTTGSAGAADLPSTIGPAGSVDGPDIEPTFKRSVAEGIHVGLEGAGNPGAR